MPPAKAEERYAAIVKALGHRNGVTHEVRGSGRKGFGSSGQLKVHNRIFAMLARGNLVVKLPRDRVDALVTARQGHRYDPRHDGRLMKEWVVVGAAAQASWLPLAEEALHFVAQGAKA